MTKSLQINIWSHLAGCILFIGLTIFDFQFLREHAELSDQVLVVCLLVCFCLCMLMSAIYHIFSCRSEEHYELFLSVDFLGISLSLVAIYISGMYYAFWCHTVGVLYRYIFHDLTDLCSRLSDSSCVPCTPPLRWACSGWPLPCRYPSWTCPWTVRWLCCCCGLRTAYCRWVIGPSPWADWSTSWCDWWCRVLWSCICSVWWHLCSMPPRFQSVGSMAKWTLLGTRTTGGIWSSLRPSIIGTTRASSMPSIVWTMDALHLRSPEAESVWRCGCATTSLV